jgi:hypothetical protein
MTSMNPQLPATTDEAAAANLPAVPGPPAAEPAAVRRPRQNIATGLFPLALALLIVVFLALAFWTLMTTTGGGL